MKLLKCKLCMGEVDVVANERSVHKKIRCRKCNFTNSTEPREPEVVVIRRRNDV